MADTQHGLTGQGLCGSSVVFILHIHTLKVSSSWMMLSYLVWWEDICCHTMKITLYNYICGWAYFEGACTISRLQYVIERIDCAQHILYLFLSIMKTIRCKYCPTCISNGYLSACSFAACLMSFIILPEVLLEGVVRSEHQGRWLHTLGRYCNACWVEGWRGGGGRRGKWEVRKGWS